MPNEHLKEPFGLTAALSSDMHNIRYINADLGEGKGYVAIASVRYRNELSQEENLATAQLLSMAPKLRDSLKECLGFVEAWQAYLSDIGSEKAAKTVEAVLDIARSRLAQATSKSKESN
jgi:hypothetical protein